MIRRSASWVVRYGGRAAAATVLRVGTRQVMDTALSAAAGVVPRAMPRSAPQTSTHVFNVRLPVTVYLRASHCRVTVRRAEGCHVTVEASLQRAFGVELTTDQDDAGVYIVARRKLVTGTAAQIEFVLTVPPESHLALNLTPGAIVFEGVDGVVQLPTEKVLPPPDSMGSTPR